MDLKQKLIELIDYAKQIAEAKCNGYVSCTNCPNRECGDECTDIFMAEELIANGVTIQKWIPVSERLPQEDEPPGAICEQVQVLLSNGVVSTGWCNRYTKLWWHLNYGETHFTGYDYEHTPVVAWQPLAQPPKGE